jgi:hypothetical protein
VEAYIWTSEVKVMNWKRQFRNEIELFRDGDLELDCSEMELVQDVAENPTLYRGPGYIRQDPEGQIRFKIYTSEARNPPPAGGGGRTGVEGRIVAGHDYFTLAATDGNGRKWVAGGVLPASIRRAESGAVITAHGHVHSLATTESSEVFFTTSGLKLHFFEEIAFPCNAPTSFYRDTGDGKEWTGSSNDHVRLSSAGCEIVIHRGDGFVTVSVEPGAKLPPQLETRITEALQFVLARTLWCRAVEYRVGNDRTTKLISARTVSAHTRLPEPVDLASVAGHRDVWLLFDAYFRYILSYTKPGWHPCAVHLHAACEASANSIEAYALGLAVAVEGMTNTLFAHSGKRDALYKSVIGDLCAYVGKWSPTCQPELVDELRPRLEGFRSQLLGLRPIDRMYAIARDGVIDERYIKPWSNLRNKSTHAGEPGSRTYQELVDRVLTAAVLMYEMVFHAIGYKGRYTDYSTYGFPARWYPSRGVAIEPTPQPNSAAPVGLPPEMDSGT